MQPGEGVDRTLIFVLPKLSSMEEQTTKQRGLGTVAGRALEEGEEEMAPRRGGGGREEGCDGLSCVGGGGGLQEGADGVAGSFLHARSSCRERVS